MMHEAPERLKDTPISAPTWLWVAYVVGMSVLGGVFAGLSGVVVAVFVMGFSFQFWTFAVHRGITRQGADQ